MTGSLIRRVNVSSTGNDFDFDFRGDFGVKFNHRVINARAGHFALNGNFALVDVERMIFLESFSNVRAADRAEKFSVLAEAHGNFHGNFFELRAKEFCLVSFLPSLASFVFGFDFGGVQVRDAGFDG